MNDELQQRKASYSLQLKRAEEYFLALTKHRDEATERLLHDFNKWEKDHKGKQSGTGFIKRRISDPNRKDYDRYIKWLANTQQLDFFLERSVSYIFMRDLGKSFTDEDTWNKITQTKDFLKKKLVQTKFGLFQVDDLYRVARNEGIEHSFIWLVDRWEKISKALPDGMDAVEAERKLMKLIAGVLMHQLDLLPSDLRAEDRSKALDEAIRLGYAYGITYPFIDDLLDADVLTVEEKKQYSSLIRETILTGNLPDISDWNGPNRKFIKLVHTELRHAFEYIKEKQPVELRDRFLLDANVFFEAQETDRAKVLSHDGYSNEDIFIPIILKSAYSRLIVRSILGAPVDEGFERRTFYYGIYNQLADDFTDFSHDLDSGSVTPYTYYYTYRNSKESLVNPFELYWTVISYLIHEVYDSDEWVREIILSRAINSLKRFKKRVGKTKYEETLAIFAPRDQNFMNEIQRLVNKAENVDFLDKLLRDQMIAHVKQEEKDRSEFQRKSEELRIFINERLAVEDRGYPTQEPERHVQLRTPLVDAANYSLESGGKRLRPILAAFMGTEEFGLERDHLLPILKSLEYMHTASLIFDDLPSQDDAEFRRGRPTLHEVHSTAIAELTGLYLTQEAVFEQASMEGFEAKNVLKLIQYSSETIIEMCKGQIMDLESKGKNLTLEQLERICFHKTGMAFEAAILMPAILAGKQEEEIAYLKEYAYHAGIAFQIKDDLLDAEGDDVTLGKLAGQDTENNTATFVTVLGIQEAKKAMWEHYTKAAEILGQTEQKTNFLRHFLKYIIHRES